MTKARGIVAQTPAVFTRDGAVFTNSRDVAMRFGKEHKNVLARIDILITQSDEIDAGLTFKLSSYVDPTGRELRSYDMDRESFSILVMGFTGEKALRWKIQYTKAFKMMEQELASRPAVPVPAPVAHASIDFNDKLQMAELAAELAKFARDMKERAEVAEAKIEEDAPKVAFAEDFGDLSGTYNLRTCGKMIGVPDRQFFAHLRRRYLYEDVNGNLLPRAEFQNRGWFVVKPVPTLSRKAHFQTRVTAPGYQRLCRDFGRIDDLADMIPGGTDMRPKLAFVQ